MEEKSNVLKCLSSGQPSLVNAKQSQEEKDAINVKYNLSIKIRHTIN